MGTFPFHRHAAMPRTTPHRATILQVAREAGVSKTSVSRYFSDERARLSRDMQSRIASAARRLSYHPNQMARGLKGGRSQLIGMLVADIRNPFSVAVMHGVEQACRERGFSLLVCNTDNDPAQEREHLALLASYRVEGLVINAAGQPSRELRALAAQGTPLVLLDRMLSDFEADVVGLDNTQTIDMALDHLRQQGYDNVLYLSEPVAQASSRQARLKHFEQRLADDPTLRGEAHSLALAEDNRLQDVIAGFLSQASGSAPAILCGNGNVTLAVAHALQARGARLGEIGLLGIDELEWCNLVGPGITTLAQPTDAIGRAAVHNLLQRLEEPQRQAPPKRTHYQARLILRGSTCRPNTPDQYDSVSQERP
ncbi:transcriptional regulator [Litchfieldella qijiaojingensis]|uniref:Transcriptional regulator n=1 Tax=Litchfieldella qijiaojingensis TaxID=980347 RepID=A0ABQ2Z2U4_9GAMM|nr:LacI family DNA-binding transcriptional regulator [Halomonas qijiaojingensis]GGY02559.1 transcriptional regulator [Halomonas qijiaojingensis]